MKKINKITRSWLDTLTKTNDGTYIVPDNTVFGDEIDFTLWDFKFGNGCKFGYGCEYGSNCEFGAGCIYGWYKFHRL